MKIIRRNIGVMMLAVTSCSHVTPSKEGLSLHIQSVADVVALFPKTVEDITQRVQRAQHNAREAVQVIIAIPTDKRTFENTARAYDYVMYVFGTELCAINMLEHVSPQKALRDASHHATQQLQEFSIDELHNNVDLYQAFRDYVQGPAQHETLTDVEHYFLDETMRAFERNGLSLPAPQLAEVKKLKKELAALCLQFGTNIADGQRSITVTKQELEGTEEDFTKALKRKDDAYVLGTDYPTYFAVMEQCSVPATRKKMYLAYGTRAYPENESILQQIIAQRDVLAKKLGFASYAALDIDDQMAKTPERAQRFIDELAAKARIKEKQEYEFLLSNVPEGVQPTADGKIQPWDRAYAVTQLKKKLFSVDEQKIAEYFPIEKTIKGLLSIYEQFMGLTLKEVPVSGLWHEDVKLVAVYSHNGNQLRGYLVMDLHPRDNKYNHAASFTILSTILDAQGNPTPAVDVVVANFPKSTPTRPSLLKHRDVETLFHEFGHAIHTILGSTTLASFSGTHVKTDFVEMPSQMLEEWMWDPQMLTMVSGHYKTGDPLPADVIQKKIALKNFDSGNFIMRQMFYAGLSLDVFKPGAEKNVHAIEKDMYILYRPFLVYEAAYHDTPAFGHLDEYGAKYYGYMWSKVFALDLFAHIKKHGLLNPEIGTQYVNKILAKGGSADPNQLLKDFLGREPNQAAFLKDLGLS